MSSFAKDKSKVRHTAPPITKSPECITPSAFDSSLRRQSAKVGIFNLISTMIGGGALSLPFAISRCGLILGFSLLTISAILSVFSFDILIATSRRTGAMTYQQISYIAFGKKISLFVTFLIWFNCYIASIAYCVLIGDLIKPVICYIFNINMSNQTETLRRIIITISILCVSPFCFMRQIGGLKYTSIISMTSVTILTIIIMLHTLQHFNMEHEIYYIDNDGNSQSFMLNTDINWLPTKWEDVIYVFPVFGISFCCHFNIPQVHSELTRPTRKRMRKVLIAVVISCFILYSTISFFGYFYSFKFTCGNILLNYRQDDPIVSFGRLCLGFVILFTFPLLILPARTSLHNILNEVCSCKNMNLQQNNDNQIIPKSHHAHFDSVQHSTSTANDASNKTNIEIESNSNQKTSLLLQYDEINNNEIQQLNTNKNVPRKQSESNNTEWDQSLDGAAVLYSMIPDVVVADEDNQMIKPKKDGLSFTTRSFSHTNSPLRQPTDALGVINEPNDMILLQEKPFIKPFKNLESAINYKPSTIWLIIETFIMICSSLLISFLTESVMVLWGLLGSTVGFMIAFTLPGFAYFKIRSHKGWTVRNIGALILAILSCFAIILCTWQAVKRISAQSCPTQPNS